MQLPTITFAAHWPEVTVRDNPVPPQICIEVMPEAPPRGGWTIPRPLPTAMLPPTRSSCEHPPPVGGTPRPSGRRFSRAELETLASGSIASVFGPLFSAQDAYRRQVRMPMPPLLLADRVTGLSGEPASHGSGTIWTETDIGPDAWYLHHGRMPAGITVEAGQADLLLCSWLGADLKNRGERVYRLLGCDLEFHDSLPGIGETLTYEIHITGHAELGGIRLFFFHSDCRSGDRLIQRVRNGQAGFFTDAELANSEGVIWSPERPEHRPPPGQVDPPTVLTGRVAFDEEAVRAFAEGRLLDCFGPGFEVGASHTRSPGIPTGRMRLFDAVTRFEPDGGPWGRGYLRAERALAPDDWFFAGHFKDDPCMPGTLMCEGGLQAMAFYLAALGVTLKRDGWRFEPLPGEAFKMRCRGQATPSSRLLVYEIFVRDFVAGPEPVLRADLLCSVDGLKAFHAAGCALRLVPGWPGDLLPPPPLRPDGEVDTFSEASAQAVALGRPSLAFGSRFARFDSSRRGPRLPGAPYHFITRIVSCAIEEGPPKAGARVEAAYDIPPDAWYFDANGARTMPFAVLLEVALQPCGWLATAVGCPLTVDQELFFRNLDGTGTQLHALTPESGRLTTRATLTSVSAFGGMILVGFDLACEAGGRPVFKATTGFGFFPEDALANQVGLAIAPHERDWLDRQDDLGLDLSAGVAGLAAGQPRIAAPPLLMLDRVTGHWPEGGRAGLGLIRGEKRVEPREWFFKAHFFQDPVQPGSLGIEALIQLLQVLMLRADMAAGIPGARFEPLMLGLETTWKYRGQVVPKNGTITTLVEVLERGRDAQGAFAVAAGTLLVDGRKIYHLPRFGMRIVPGSGLHEAVAARDEIGFAEELELDPAKDAWLADHCPTFVIPALPLVVTADLLAGAAAHIAGGRRVVGLRDLKVRGWITFPGGARRLRIEADRRGAVVSLRLLVWREAPRAAMSRFDLIATAEADLAAEWPPSPSPWPPCPGGTVFHARGDAEARDMYAEGDTFHGPAFRRILTLRWSGVSGSARIDADPGSVPNRLLNPLLLDSAIQAIAGDTAPRLDPSLPPDTVIFPAEIERLVIHGPPPIAGEVRCELRYRGRSEADPRFLRFAVQMIQDDQVWAEMDLVEVGFAKGRFTGAAALDRRDMALRRRPVPGMTIGRMADGTTQLDAAEILTADWLPGTVARIYAAADAGGSALWRAVAIKDHLAAAWNVHPATVHLDPDRRTARSTAMPFLGRAISISETERRVVVSDAGPDRLDHCALTTYWADRLGGPENAVVQLLDALCERFLARVRLDDPDAMQALRGRPMLLVANHQLHVESVIMSEILGPLLGVPAVTVSRSENRSRWIGGTVTLPGAFPGAGPHEPVLHFDRYDPADMLRLLADYRQRLLPQGRSLVVHVTGDVATSCREPVGRVSSVLLDLAIACDMPVVPMRFIGGLPVAGTAEHVFPVGYARQEVVLGKPVMPAELRNLNLLERGRAVVAAINAITPPAAIEVPNPPQTDFAARIARRMAGGATEVSAVLREAMEDAAIREPRLAPMTEDRLPEGWSGARAEWGRRVLDWIRDAK